MKIGIPREVHPGERRVAITPDSAKKLKSLGFEVSVECGAGLAAGFADADYGAAGVEMVAAVRDLWSAADIVLKVRPPERHPDLAIEETDLLREGGALIAFLWPAQNAELIERFKARKATTFAMDMVPRITRAQKMDALSSMANLAGYRAIIEAAHVIGRFFTAQMTAAGKLPPVKVLVIGAGVAGLSAIGAARGLGAIVRAFDTRPAAREQVQSLGAEFLEVTIEEDGDGAGGYAKVMSPAFIKAEMELFAAQAKEVDIIVTTALIPGKKAPTLLDEALVQVMKPGSVIVDLAAEQGGNCVLTKPGEHVVAHGVNILGYTDLPSRMARQASELYGNNIFHLLHDMGGAERFDIDLDDEVVRGTIVTQNGELLWPPPKPSSPPVPPPKVEPKSPHSKALSREVAEVRTAKQSGPGLWPSLALLAVAGGLIALGQVAPAEFFSQLTIFVLACFVGWQVIWNVTPALHTPLMSVTNAISGIIVVGGILHQQAGRELSPAGLLGLAAVAVAMINVSGGFLVTQRMLRMFRK